MHPDERDALLLRRNLRRSSQNFSRCCPQQQRENKNSKNLGYPLGVISSLAAIGILYFFGSNQCIAQDQFMQTLSQWFVLISLALSALAVFVKRLLAE